MGNVTPIEKKETVNPIIITDNETGYKYTLEFNRNTVERAEKSGFTFSTEALENSPMTTITNLWYWSFQMHHRNMSKDKTNELLEMVGVTQAMIERLALLYNEPFNTLIVDDGEDEPKNSRMTVQL